MKHLSEYVAVSPDLFRPEQVLGVNLHIFMPLNRNVVFFRRMGDVLTPSDHVKITQLPKNTLLVHRSERELVLSPLAEELARDLRAGAQDSARVRRGATLMLQSVTPEAAVGETPSGDVARKLLSDLPKVVEGVVGGLEQTPSVQAYESVLKNSRGQNENPVIAHNQQVSAIAVLIRMTVGGDPLLQGKGDASEDLACVGAAGLLHDIGLLSTPRPLTEKHLFGDEELTVSEKLVYMKHIDQSLVLAQKSGTKVCDEVLLAISQHHENFDGSGFRGLEGKTISYLARILRIADELVSTIHHPANTFGFQQALGHLVWKERQAGIFAYDPAILAALAELH